MKQKPVSFSAYGQDISNFRMPKHFFSLYYSDIPYNAHIVTHFHHTIELMLVMSGTVSVSVEGQLLPMREGDISIVQPQQMHRTLIHTPEKPYIRYVLHLNPDFIRDLLRRQQLDPTLFDYLFHNCVLQCTPESTLFASSLMERLHTIDCENRIAENVSSDAGSVRYMPCMQKYSNDGRSVLPQYAYAECLIQELLLYFSMYESKAPRQAVPITNPLMEKTVQYIHEHFREPELSLHQIADALFVSQGHLCRIFKKYAGISVYNFIIQKRLTDSQLLLQSGMGVMDACIQCGFGDYSSYLRAFRSAYHMTPREYVALQNRAFGAERQESSYTSECTQ